MGKIECHVNKKKKKKKKRKLMSLWTEGKEKRYKMKIFRKSGLVE